MDQGDDKNAGNTRGTAEHSGRILQFWNAHTAARSLLESSPSLLYGADDSDRPEKYTDGLLLPFIALAILLAWTVHAAQLGRVDTDTRAKLERTAQIEAQITARRAARFAGVIAGCLNGGAITDGARVVACTERQ